MFSYLFVILIGYLLGSIPFGLLLTRLVKGVDIREHGSGNIGATNAYRIMGFGMGVMVALFDISKGYFGVLIAKQVFGTSPSLILILAGLAAVAGHNWPIFLKFNGGRGVATSVGVLISLMPKAVLIAFFVWLITVLTTRYVSLGSILGAALIPILAILFNNPLVYVSLGIAIATFVIYRHRPNIKRLLAGEENKIGWNMNVDTDDE
ncbi:MULTISPECIES: glycerol-3-phosphate 1-O-acyltransferase PlsY [unclassified Candidatus Frackibacter]|uniref:glycerol-3-phosphate 1-O-acyltransferase PlsY n=1 Tax=unclassified Candidatus Frackibacter TaxID=2648818 RepID=UPI000797806D|nr:MULTISPECIES: glycerol-3-phosphate 1-O-acyltransferase PlsY [unclassified Candidatus Frackibacter]KXS42310.1 MAG: glycerol-3-phosphate acyltransferase PlsY [Candidatus Frackibacter sp. T328-2]SDC52499.1 acyl-phosphate glycerol-3-phosphate acyltransferase [Candidatus Frackibacter sp. WG11]SEM41597.1 acyl-phosphate glycerol-3-phosphate acyltransferase [Candidatus Frackibacter sp. WG12]SFL76305.1 acyl-phosphate glycerol-3-phosphate acyltransferase [Candidatus Frackibacter sp. WG13]